MSDTQTMADQLGWCITTKDALKELEQSLYRVANDYDATVETLRATRVFNEYAAVVEQRQEHFRESVRDLLSSIQNDNLAYINKQSARIQQELQKI